jgi:hypothetical protein
LHTQKPVYLGLNGFLKERDLKARGGSLRELETKKNVGESNRESQNIKL